MVSPSDVFSLVSPYSARFTFAASDRSGKSRGSRRVVRALTVRPISRARSSLAKSRHETQVPGGAEELTLAGDVPGVAGDEPSIPGTSSNPGAIPGASVNAAGSPNRGSGRVASSSRLGRRRRPSRSPPTRSRPARARGGYEEEVISSEVVSASSRSILKRRRARRWPSRRRPIPFRFRPSSRTRPRSPLRTRCSRRTHGSLLIGSVHLILVAGDEIDASTFGAFLEKSRVVAGSVCPTTSCRRNGAFASSACALGSVRKSQSRVSAPSNQAARAWTSPHQPPRGSPLSTATGAPPSRAAFAALVAAAANRRVVGVALGYPQEHRRHSSSASAASTFQDRPSALSCVRRR